MPYILKSSSLSPESIEKNYPDYAGLLACSIVCGLPDPLRNSGKWLQTTSLEPTATGIASALD